MRKSHEQCPCTPYRGWSITSEETTVWVLAYVSVMSIRLHPRNDEDVHTARQYANIAAEWALKDYQERFTCHGSDQSSEE
jgi:hypothetical protein